jgi:hypothetical protein
VCSKRLDAHPAQTGLDHAQFLGRTVREINRPAAGKRAPVRNAHPDRFSIGQVRYLDGSPEQERGMSRSKGRLIIDFATSRGVAVKARSIPGGNPELPGRGVSRERGHDQRRTLPAAAVLAQPFSTRGSTKPISKGT